VTGSTVAETTTWGWLLVSLAVLVFVGAVAVTLPVIWDGAKPRVFSPA
jgi:hypothetical protein